MSLEATRWARRQKGLSGPQRAVLLELADRLNGATGRCDPGVKCIAEDTGYSVRAVQYCLRALEARGLIEQHYRGPKTTASYVLRLDEPVAKPASEAGKLPPQELHPPPARAAPPPLHELHPPPARAAPKPGREPRRENREENLSPLPPKIVPMAVVPPGFHAFWARLPEQARMGMEAARRAYEAEIRRGATHEQLLEAASRYLLNPDPRFTKHPANWLKEGHWKDEPPAAAPPANDGNLSSFPADKPSKTAWVRKYLPTVPTGLTIDGEVELVR